METLWKYLKIAWDIAMEALGPPDLDDEKALRKYLDKVFDLLGWLAMLTRWTDEDDRIVRRTRVIVDNDVSWRLFYQLLLSLEQAIGLDADEIAFKAHFAKALDPQGVPWVLIWMLLKQLIELLKKRAGN